MRKLLVILVGLLSICSILHAQKISDISLFSQNQTFYNPGATGHLNVLGANVFLRQGLIGFEGAPSTQVFSVHFPFKKLAPALGLMVERDATGATNTTGFHFSYAYRLGFENSRLAFGIRASMLSFSQSLDGRDPADVTLSDDNYNFVIPNFGFGLLYSTPAYWVGISVPRLLGFETNSSGSNTVYFDINTHEYYLSGGGSFKLASNLDIEPSALLKYSLSYSPTVAVNALLVYQNSYKAGLGYRSGSSAAMVLIIGYNLNRQFALAYSYDMGIADLANYNSGAHEINLQYTFGYKVSASNPRGF